MNLTGPVVTFPLIGPRRIPADLQQQGALASRATHAVCITLLSRSPPAHTSAPRFGLDLRPIRSPISTAVSKAGVSASLW